jgi:hypothetical protein
MYNKIIYFLLILYVCTSCINPNVKAQKEEVEKLIKREREKEEEIKSIQGKECNAVLILSLCWKYGEKLRRWHNLDTQIGNEGEKANKSGGVLNPAMLSVG